MSVSKASGGKLTGGTGPKSRKSVSKNNGGSKGDSSTGTSLAGGRGEISSLSTSSLPPGSSKKRPAFEASSTLDSDDGDVPLLDDEDDLLSGQHVNHLLTQLGSQIQNRLRAKKQKLDKNFQGF